MYFARCLETERSPRCDLLHVLGKLPNLPALGLPIHEMGTLTTPS